MSTDSAWLSRKRVSSCLEVVVHVDNRGGRGTNLHDAGTPGSPLHLQGSHPELDFTPLQARQSAAHLLYPGRHGHCRLPQIYGLLPDLLHQESAKAGTLSWSLASSSVKAAGKRSDRVEKSCPTLMKGYLVQLAVDRKRSVFLGSVQPPT
ncbi:MAG: hypothetical protein FRX49_06048 [Trebouxia sp. A1-2]|nr:MAG: hypothetical protein FRX49_06048 [Trebouxia sp. A1-2]